MVFAEDTYENINLNNRLRFQLLIGIIGILLGILASILSTAYIIILHTFANSVLGSWDFLSRLSLIIGFTGSLFSGAGILGFLVKHEFEFTWVVGLLIIVGVLFFVVNPYIIFLVLSVFDDLVIYSYFSTAHSLIVSFVYFVCYWMIRDRVRNKFLLGNLALRGFVGYGFSYILWYFLYGTPVLHNPELTTILPYYLGTLAMSIITGLLVLLLFIDERRYDLYSSDESIVIDQRYDT